jgi:hypothetical protein
MERRNIQETPAGDTIGYYPKGHYKEFDTWFISRVEIRNGKDGICFTFNVESKFMLEVLSKM